MNEIKLIATVLNDSTPRSDAIICLQGDGYLRAEMAAKLFKRGVAPLIVVSGGLDNPPNAPSAQYLADCLIDNGVKKNNIVLERVSQHTQDQAVEVMKLVRERKWNKIILVASAFHQLRAFLTFLKVRGEFPVAIYNAPVENLSWFENTHWGDNRLRLLEKELEKIAEYSKKGHLATFKEGLEHQQWKEKIKMKIL